MELVIASKNLHKIRELKMMLKEIGSFDILTLFDFTDYSPPEEKGETFADNAFTKASHAAKHLSRFVIADDSGLLVPALGNLPGVHSARYAGQQASDKDNRNKLITELQKLDEQERCGSYICCLCFASPDGVQGQYTGSCEGYLRVDTKGIQGFGYDPLFIKDGYSKTFAEIEEATKNKISHRRKAFDKLIPLLNKFI